MTKSKNQKQNPIRDELDKILCESSLTPEEQIFIKKCVVHEIQRRILTVHAQAPSEYITKSQEEIKKLMLEQLLGDVARLIMDNESTCFSEADGRLHLTLTLFQNR